MHPLICLRQFYKSMKLNFIQNLRINLEQSEALAQFIDQPSTTKCIGLGL